MADYTVAFIAVNGIIDPNTGRPALMQILPQDTPSLHEAGVIANNYNRIPGTTRLTAELYLKNRMNGDASCARILGIGIQHPDKTIDLIHDFTAVRAPYRAPTKNPIRLTAAWLKSLLPGSKPPKRPVKADERAMEVV